MRGNLDSACVQPHHAVVRAQLARALAARRLVIGRVFRVADVDSPVRAGEEQAVAPGARGEGGVERVHSQRHRRADARLVADT
jgi:hypothetical protein